MNEFPERMVWLAAIIGSMCGFIGGYLLGWASERNRRVNRRKNWMP